MDYEFKYDDDTQCIEVKMFGQLHLIDLPQYASDLAALLKKYDCKRVLQDLTEVDLKLAAFEFLDVPKLARGANVMRDAKRAIVCAKDTENWKFYETVAVNRGEYVRVFKDFDKAKEWLMG